MVTFGQRLKALREAAGITQFELAERAGIARTTLARLETDVAVPGWETVRALARVFGVKCTAFDDDDEPPPTPAAGRTVKKGAGDAAAGTKPARRKGKG